MQAAASKALSELSFEIGIEFAIDGRAGADVDVATGGDDAVEGSAVRDEIFDDGKRIGAKGLDPDGIAVTEFPHMYLASGNPSVLGVRDAVDGEGAGTADALAAIVVEVNRVVALLDDALVDDVEHFQKGGFLGNAVGGVGVDAAF